MPRLSIDCIGNSPKLHQLREKDSLTFEDISCDQFITAHKQKPASLLSMSLLFVWASGSESLYFLLLWKHPVCIIYCLLSVCLRLTGGSAFVNIFLLSLFFFLRLNPQCWYMKRMEQFLIVVLLAGGTHGKIVFIKNTKHSHL